MCFPSQIILRYSILLFGPPCSIFDIYPAFFGADFSHQTRKFFRKCERISIKSADFRTKRASSCKKRSKTFENVRKYSKTEWKYSKTEWKYSKIFNNFLPICAND